jgi:hypothetical protein
MDGDVPWDVRGIVLKARPNSITLEKGNLGTHMRATYTSRTAIRATKSDKHLHS